MANQPNSYKKFVATAATAALVASALIPAASAAETKSFTDVNKNYKVAVDYLVTNEITEGFSDTIFGTDSPIKRGDAAIFIAKALGLDTVNAPSADFTDVNSRVKGAVNAIVNAKIATGKSESTFAPDDNITRAEMAKILVNAYKLKAGDTKNTFTDVNSTWDGYVDALLESGVTLGLSETTFGATQNVTRGQFALFIHRAEVPFELKVASATATDAKTLAVKLSDGTTHEVKLTTALEANKETEVSFEINGKKYTAKVTYVVVSQEVVTVSAIDAITVVAKVNTELSKASAEDVNLYKVNGAVPSKATLSADGKTVTLTVAKIANKTQVPLTILKNLQTATGEDFAEVDYTTNFLFSDTVAPTVSAISTPNGSLRVAFSEKLNAPVSGEFVVVVNGQSVAVTSGMVNGNVVTLPKTTVDTLGLTANSSYAIAIAGAKDLVANEMAFYSGNFTYQVITDTVAPTVTAVTAVGENAITVKFSEEVTNPVVTVKRNNGSDVIVYPVATKDGVNFVYNLGGLYNNPGQVTEGLQVSVSAARDLGNNVLAPSTTAVNLTKDTAKPVLSSATYNSTVERAVLKFNEDILAVDGSNLGVNAALASNIVVINNATSAVVPSSNLTYSVTDDSIEVAGLATGSYTFRVNAGTVKDVSLAGNLNNAFTTTVAVAVTVQPTPVDVKADVTRDTITVTFTQQVAGGTGVNSATNLANYRIDGQALPTGSFATLATDAVTKVSKVTITLPTGSFASDRTGILTVSDVKTANGATVPTANVIVGIEDTKAPVLNSAKVVGTNLELTLSESVKDSSFTGSNQNDFVVKVNGVTVTSVVSTGSTANDNKLIITTSDASLATGAITVQVIVGANGTDLAIAPNTIVTGTVVTATR